MFEAENSCKNLSLEFFSSCFQLIKSKFGWLVDQLQGCDNRHDITPWGQTKWDQPLMGQAAEVTVAREEQVKILPNLLRNLTSFWKLECMMKSIFGCKCVSFFLKITFEPLWDRDLMDSGTTVNQLDWCSMKFGEQTNNMTSFHEKNV